MFTFCVNEATVLSGVGGLGERSSDSVFQHLVSFGSLVGVKWHLCIFG